MQHEGSILDNDILRGVLQWNDERGNLRLHTFTLSWTCGSRCRPSYVCILLSANGHPPPPFEHHFAGTMDAAYSHYSNTTIICLQSSKLPGRNLINKIWVEIIIFQFKGRITDLLET